MTATIERIGPAPLRADAEVGITLEQLNACLPGSTFTQVPLLGQRCRVKQADGRWDRYETRQEARSAHEDPIANGGLSSLDRYHWDLLILPLAVGDHPEHEVQVDALPIGSQIALVGTPSHPWTKREDGEWTLPTGIPLWQTSGVVGERWIVTRVGPDSTQATQPETETTMTSTITARTSRPEMTPAVRHVLPFPKPGEPLTDVAQLDALPSGSTIGYLAQPTQLWTKLPTGMWGYHDRDAEAEEWESSSFALDDSFGVISIPDLTPDQIAELPVGSVIWAEPSNPRRTHYTGRWERRTCMDPQATGYNQQAWLPAGTVGGTNNGIMFVNRDTYEVAAVWLLYVPEPEVADDEVADDNLGPITVATDGVVEGMLLSLDEDSPTFLVYAIDRTEGLRWLTVEFPDDSTYTIDGRTQPPQRQWVLHPQSTLHQVAGQWATARRELAEAQAEAQRAASEQEQRVTIERDRDRLQRRLDQLNSELLSKVSSGDLDESEMRDVLEDFADIGMTPPMQDYGVTFDVRFRFSRSVSAVDSEAAVDAARDAAAFVEGNCYNCHGESMELMDMTVYEID